MKKLKDIRSKSNPAILDNFLIIPDGITSKQNKALSNIRKILKWELKDVESIGSV